MMDDRVLTSAEQMDKTAKLLAVVALARMAKAIEDTERVASFNLSVVDKDCVVYIETTWGVLIAHSQPREHWVLAVGKACDELDAIKPEQDDAATTADVEA